MATAVPLPPAEWQFFDNNGVPLAGGLVYTYIPNTTTPKTTWQDPAQATPNTNPITLDSAGRAVIWGSGIYRMQLFDAVGDLIWDKQTEAADVNYVASQLAAFVGDSGSGGVQGQVPAPPVGSTAAGYYLSAGGIFQPLLVIIPATPAVNQAGRLFPQSRILSTSGTLALSDAGGSINYANVAGGGTITIPSDATAGWPANVITQVRIITNTGAASVTVTAAAGVQLLWPGNSLSPANRTLAPNALAVLSREGANVWTIIGAGIT